MGATLGLLNSRKDQSDRENLFEETAETIQYILGEKSSNSAERIIGPFLPFQTKNRDPKLNQTKLNNLTSKARTCSRTFLIFSVLTQIPPSAGCIQKRECSVLAWYLGSGIFPKCA